MQSVESRIAELDRRKANSRQSKRVLIVDGTGADDNALNEAKAKSIATVGPLRDGEEWFPVLLIPGNGA